MDPNHFRPKPRVRSLVGHLSRVSYISLVCQLLVEDDEGDDGMGGYQGQCYIFSGICLTTEDNLS